MRRQSKISLEKSSPSLAMRRAASLQDIVGAGDISEETKRSIDHHVSRWSNDTDFGIKTPNSGVIKLMEILNIKDKDEELLEQRATPGQVVMKRHLLISPDTPAGMSLKIMIPGSGSPELREDFFR